MEPPIAERAGAGVCPGRAVRRPRADRRARSESIRLRRRLRSVRVVPPGRRGERVMPPIPDYRGRENSGSVDSRPDFRNLVARMRSWRQDAPNCSRAGKPCGTGISGRNVRLARRLPAISDPGSRRTRPWLGGGQRIRSVAAPTLATSARRLPAIRRRIRRATAASSRRTPKAANPRASETGTTCRRESSGKLRG